MSTLIQDPFVEQEVIDERRARRLDRWDEVWEGTYVIMPLPNNQHQELLIEIASVLKEVVRDEGLGRVFPGCNVSDRNKGWKRNFRCPDVAVFLNDNPATDRSTHWQGGPDLAIEIVNPDDRSRDKLDFYASIHTRELLILDREPWSLELYRLSGGALVESETLDLVTLPLSWELATRDGATVLLIRRRDDGREWLIAT